MRSDPPRPPGLFCHTYGSRLDAFDGLVRALTAWADAAGVAPPTLRDVVLVLDELFSNIVIHGYRHDPRGAIRVAAAVELVWQDYATQGEDIRIDVILLAPGRKPTHIENAWLPFG